MIKQAYKFSNIMNATGLLMLFFLFLAISGFPQSTKEKEKLLRTKQKLEEEIRNTADVLSRTQKNKEISINKLKILAKQIKNREALINAINRELNEVQVTMTVDSIQIDRLSKQLHDLKLGYARMIYNAYRIMNGHNKLMFIFSARDFNQAYQRLRYYQQYASYRRSQAERIQSTQKAILAHRQDLEEIRGQKLNLVNSKQLEKQKLDHEKTEKANAVKELSTKEKQLYATLKTKQQAARRLEAAIEKLIAEEIKASDNRSSKKELSSTFSANRGRLPWPCDRGFISGSFGEHNHPVLKHVKVKNNGIDIMTDQGSAVKSVFGGVVSRVMSFSGLNNVVIIRHGEYLTVYSNLDEVNVRDGQEVTVKQTIGKVHSNSGEQKSELHFELWHGKKIQDPEEWLTKK
ncbi:MAG: peptidoglycan DD-metalloendopeptidase family protein [Bacteroidales bacterium]|nr:peptidoglycan DD-metalloendopeptidase family protein [Bacteroidales bacterium]